MNKTLKLIIGGFLGVIVFAILLIFGFNQIQQIQAHNAEVAAHKKAVAAEKKKETAFNKSYEQFVSDAGTTASQSETIGGKFYDTWRKVIYDGQVKLEGATWKEMDLALQVQANVLKDDISKVDKDADNMKNDFATMEKNVTKKNQERFNKAKNFYDNVTKFHNLSTTASGSFDTFSKEFNQLDSDIAAQMDGLKK